MSIIFSSNAVSGAIVLNSFEIKFFKETSCDIWFTSWDRHLFEATSRTNYRYTLGHKLCMRTDLSVFLLACRETEIAVGPRQPVSRGA
jgi:hypothetical protein